MVPFFCKLFSKDGQAGARDKPDILSTRWLACCMLDPPFTDIYNANAFDTVTFLGPDPQGGLARMLFALPFFAWFLQDPFQPWSHGPLLRDLGCDLGDAQMLDIPKELFCNIRGEEKEHCKAPIA